MNRSILYAIFALLITGAASATPLIANYTFYANVTASSSQANDSTGTLNLTVSGTVVFPFNDTHEYGFANNSGGRLISTNALPNMTINNSFTGMVWAMVNDSNLNQTIFFNRNDTNNRVLLHFHHSGSTFRCEAVIQTTAGAAVSSNGTASCLADAKFHSYIFAFNNTNNVTDFYYDNSQVSTDTQGGTSATNGVSFGMTTALTQNLSGAVGYSLFYGGIATSAERSNFQSAGPTGIGGSVAFSGETVTANYSSATKGTIGYIGAVGYAWTAPNILFAQTGTTINTPNRPNILLGKLAAMSTMTMMDVDGAIHPTATSWLDNAGPSWIYNLTALRIAAKNYTDAGIAIGLNFVFTPAYMRNVSADCTTSQKTCLSNDTTALAKYIYDGVMNISQGNQTIINNIALIQRSNECYGTGSVPNIGFCDSDQWNRTKVADKSAVEYLEIYQSVTANFTNSAFCYGDIFYGSTAGTNWTNRFYSYPGITNTTVNALCNHAYSQPTNFETQKTQITNLNGLGFAGKPFYNTEYGSTDDTINLNSTYAMRITVRTPILGALEWEGQDRLNMRYKFTSEVNQSNDISQEGFDFTCFDQTSNVTNGCGIGLSLLKTTFTPGAAIKNTTWSGNVRCVPTLSGVTRSLTCINEGASSTAVNVSFQDNTTYTWAYDNATNTNYTVNGNWFNFTIDGANKGTTGGTAFFQLSSPADTTPPVVTVASPANTTYNTTTILVSFNATDDVAVNNYWYNNGTANTTYTTPVNITVPFGAWSYTFYANDTSGNVGSQQVNFSVDTNQTTTNWWNDSTGQIYFPLNMSAGKTYIIIVNTTGGYNANGSNVFKAFNDFTSATDNNTNQWGCNSGGYCVVTASGLQVGQTALPFSGIISKNSYGVNTSFVVSAVTGGASVLTDATVGYFNTLLSPTQNLWSWGYEQEANCYASGQTCAAYNASIGVTPSLYPIVAYQRQVEMWRNGSSSKLGYATTSFINNGLSLIITNSTDVNTNLMNVSVFSNTTSSANNRKVYVDYVFVKDRIDNAYTSNVSGSGIYTVVLRSNANFINYPVNISGITATQNMSITVSNGVPGVTVFNPQNVSYNSHNVSINFSATSSSGIIDTQWYFNGSANVTYTVPTTTLLNDAYYQWTFYANDTANNIGSTPINFLVDTTPPTLTVNSPANTTYVGSNNVTVNLTYSDALAGIDRAWYDNGSANVSYSGVSTFSVPDGYYTWKFYVNDTAGNQKNVNVSFIVSTGTPVVTVNTPKNQSYASTNMTVNFSASVFFPSIDKLWYNNGTANVSFTTQTNVNLSDGYYSWIFYANSTTGQIGSTSVAFQVDNTAPIVTVTSPVNATYNQTSSVVINFTSTDNQTSIDKRWYYNGTGNATYTTPVTLTLPDGFYAMVFYSNNTNNLIGSARVNFSVDATPPVLSNLNAYSNDTYAQVNYTTNEPSNTSINYGTTTSLGTKQSSASLVTSHVTNLTGLTANTTYYYNVTSCDAYTNCKTDGIFNFTTTLFVPANATLYITGIQEGTRIYNFTVSVYDSSNNFLGTKSVNSTQTVVSTTTQNLSAGTGSVSTYATVYAWTLNNSVLEATTLTFRVGGCGTGPTCGYKLRLNYTNGTSMYTEAYTRTSSGDAFITFSANITNNVPVVSVEALASSSSGGTGSKPGYCFTTNCAFNYWTPGYINYTGLSNATYTIYANYSSQFLGDSENFTVTQQYNNFTFTFHLTNTINIYVYNENTLQLINNTNVSIYLAGSIGGYNYTTSNGTLNASLIIPDTYSVVISAAGYSTRSYVLVFTSGSIQYLNYYLLPNGYNTLVVSDVDQSYNAVPGYQNSLLRQNASGSNYFEVERCTGDINGQCIMSANICTVNDSTCNIYKILVYDSEGNLAGNSQPLRFSTQSITLLLNINGPDIATVNQYLGTVGYLTDFNIANGNIDFVLDNSNNLIASAELVIQRRIGTDYVTLSDTTDAGFSSVVISGGDQDVTLGDEFIAKAYITDAHGNVYLFDTKTFGPYSGGLGSSKNAASSFIGIGLVMLPLLAFGMNPIMAVGGMAAILFIVSAMGLLTFTAKVVGGIIVLGGIILWLTFK